MINVIATNITSPLGLTTRENYLAVKSGKSALKVMRDWNGFPGQLCAGVFPEDQRRLLLVDGFTWFESLMIRSIADAVRDSGVDLGSSRTGLIIGTTKANVDELGVTPGLDGNYSAPGEAAAKVSSYFGMTTTPIVVCNACVSGVSGQILAKRLILADVFDTVVVCGADTLNLFCVAGFNCFKAMSAYPCKPFDIERMGLNLGECAATVILSGKSSENGPSWSLVRGRLDNDAYNISAPAPSGEGMIRVVRNVLDDEARSNLATVCVHGTATMFNDQMESVAIEDQMLSDVPLSSFKPYYGHTLGAAGVVEPIIAMNAVDDGAVLPILGFEEIGVSGKINISGNLRPAEKSGFLKMISGFGGCNGAAYYSKLPYGQEDVVMNSSYTSVKGLKLTNEGFSIDGESVTLAAKGPEMLTEIYRNLLNDNTRYYKMDLFSRMVYVSVGTLVRDSLAGVAPESLAMILFNRRSSIIADRQHLSTFSDPENFYPSPAVFINTLPNVVVGEIAVKYSIKGETDFVILPFRDEQIMKAVVETAFMDSDISTVITGWVDCGDDKAFEADLKLLKRN